MTFPSFYFGPAVYYKLLKEDASPLFSESEHFIKQTFRNRTSIYGPNGIQKLSIPLKKWGRHTPIAHIEISYAEDWQTQHWRSLCTAYNRSPFFEYFQDDFEQLYSEKIHSLLEWNEQCFFVIRRLLDLDIQMNYSTDFNPLVNIKPSILSTKTKTVLTQFEFPFYLQTFNDKHGFIPNLSIIDVLFNLGTETTTYLNSISSK